MKIITASTTECFRASSFVSVNNPELQTRRLRLKDVKSSTRSHGHLQSHKSSPSVLDSKARAPVLVPPGRHSIVR